MKNHIKRTVELIITDTFTGLGENAVPTVVRNFENRYEATYIHDKDVVFEINENLSEVKLIKNGQEIIFKISSLSKEHVGCEN